MMDKPENRSDKTLPYQKLFKEDLLPTSVMQIIKKIPRINFKKIKLTNQNINSSLEIKNITKIYLDDSLDKLRLPVARVTEEKDYDINSANPLRKKIEQEEINTQLQEIQSKKPEVDVTFNLEAQINHEEEDVIFSPSTVSVPYVEEDVLSTSGEQATFVWPPPSIPTSVKEAFKKKTRKHEKTKKIKKKSTVYFLSKEESNKPIPKKELISDFPWVDSSQNYQPIEEIFKGGLESELIDNPIEDVLSIELSSEQITYKAISPQILPELFPEDIKQGLNDVELSAILNKKNEVNFGIDVVGRVKNMFGKFGNVKISPIRIVIIGGVTVCIGYVLWNYFPQNINTVTSYKENVVVNDFFKKKHKVEKGLKSIPGRKLAQEVNNKLLQPITEKERLALILMAREALGNKSDPFGQEAGLSFFSLKKDKTGSAVEEEVLTFSAQRKQIELVGVVSAKDMTLALVNVYTADYEVGLEDDEASIEKKLKDALSMALPNRLEVSVLDPVEDWSVRAIKESKSKSEDPTIELVKEDKKFKLRVGQKVLLPEEKTLEEIKAELEEEQFSSKASD